MLVVLVWKRFPHPVGFHCTSNVDYILYCDSIMCDVNDEVQHKVIHKSGVIKSYNGNIPIEKIFNCKEAGLIKKC